MAGVADFNGWINEFVSADTFYMKLSDSHG